MQLDPNKKTHGCFKKAHWMQTNKTHQKSHSSFPLKNELWIKSKICSTLVQLTVHFLMKHEEQQQKLNDLKKRDQFEQFE